MFYSDEFRAQALEMAEKIGVKKTSKELHVGAQTLYNWQKHARSHEVQPVAADNSEKSQISNLSELGFDINQELDEQRKLNQSCQQTIRFLVEENAALRQQCENYLKAITLISQR